MKAIELGATAFLNKPINFVELLPRIRDALVVEEEMEQGQAIRFQLAAKEEVVSQPAVEVLDRRTGEVRLAGR